MQALTKLHDIFTPSDSEADDPNVVNKPPNPLLTRNTDPNFRSLPGLTEGDVTQAFCNIDGDLNGFLSAEEIRTVLEKLGIENESDEVIDEMIRMADPDGMGQVSLEGFIKLLQIPCMVGQMKTHNVTSRNKKKIKKGGGLKASDCMGQGAHLSRIQSIAAKEKPEEEEEELDEDELDRRRILDAVNFMQTASQTRLLTISENQPKLYKSRGRSRQIKLAKDKEEGIVKLSALTKIMGLFHEMDADGSGAIDYLEFCKVLQMDPNPMVEQLFNMFDSDGSGQIEEREFIVGLSSYVNLSMEERAKFSFLMIDKDGSGFIEKDELITILKANFISKSAISEEVVELKATKILASVGLPPTGRLDYTSFLQVVSHTPGLLFPAHALMDKLEKITK